MNVTGYPNAGLQIKADVNTTLTSFVVNNQGAADTVSLTDVSGNVLQTIPLPSGQPTYIASVSWPLTAGTSYNLILAGASNGRWAAASFPATDGSLEVDGTWGDGVVQSTFWFTFTSLQTCP
jgi:hypothetical protein